MSLEGAFEEVAKHKQDMKAWWTITARQFRPKEATKLNEEMVASRIRLFDRFKQLPDGAELARVVARLTALQFAFAFYRGFRRGYNVQRSLGKLKSRSQEDYAKARIADLCIKHPDWSTKRVFGALDDENVPLIFLGRIHQEKKSRAKPKYWGEVAGDSVYKMLVSRIKDKMQKEARLKGWEMIMKRHAKLRKQQK